MCEQGVCQAGDKRTGRDSTLPRSKKCPEAAWKELRPLWEHSNLTMRIIALRTLREYWTSHADAEDALRAWYADAKQAEWKSPAEIRVTYANASFLAHNRVVFNIRGNTYRLIVAVNYSVGIVYIRFVGTHAEYDKINAETI